MKLSREIKTAILVIASILLFIWGYSFLKGRDLFTNYKNLYVEYVNVEGLTVSSPVTINGLVVGKVNSIVINNETGKIKVEMQINSDFPIKKTSVAEIYAPSPIGGKQIAIIPTKEGQDAVDGDFLVSSSKLGLTDELAKQIEPLKDKITKLLDNANVMLENVNQVLDAKSKENLRNSLANLNETLAQFKGASKEVNEMLAQNKSKISGTMSNVEKASANFSKVSDSLAKANIGQTVKNLEKTLANVDKMMGDMQAGKGTMGKLMKDDAMYNNFTKTSKELELLLQDLRLNPTRYVNVSLFGKKNKPYVAPINDTIK
ncbi:MAG: MlaD family protein [Flavobacterium sp.]|uniref:MlaD family protein n=1 Tax=Flavobacterium sp. TaxID=239 RepID=UPI000AC35FE2|nr:MlaD family protein [Flavobacterium sp.]